MANSLRPSPLSFDSGRQSPFKRPNSGSPAPARVATPAQSPTKPTGGLSPVKCGSLSPEKTSPFVRRPSQISQSSDRSTSPFARPTSGVGNSTSSSRELSSASQSDTIPQPSPRRTASPEEEDADLTPSGLRLRSTPIPSPFGGPASPAPDSPSVGFPSQSNLRPTAHRTTTASSTTSTIKPPAFTTQSSTAPSRSVARMALNAPAFGTNTKIPPPLLRSMRESFEVLDTNNTGSVNSASIANMLEQMGMPNNPSDLRDFFPPNAPSDLNLARYLDTISAPLADLSPPEELLAAFSAFDVDDSGQIDVAEFRRALLDTAPEPGEAEVGVRLSEREVDAVLAEFCGRRAFGAKGTNVAKGKGEVFRYREFMGAITGGADSASVGGEGIIA